MAYDKIQIPADGDKITVNADYSLNVPDRPIVPFIEGDGIGVDVTPVIWLGLISLVRELLVGQQGLLTQVMIRASVLPA